MKDHECTAFLKWALPHLRMRWEGFRKVRRQVCRRITARMIELKLNDFSEYKDYLEKDEMEWQVVDRFCRIPISRFYRDRDLFSLLENRLLPVIVEELTMTGNKELRCWSLGCASGEEAYTIKIIWESFFRSKFPELNLSILATDSDPHMIERAQNSKFTKSSIKELPLWLCESVFDIEDDVYILKKLYKNGISFINQDIRYDKPDNIFNIVLCRNLVFIYFDESLQREIIDSLIERIEIGGFLVIGNRDSIPDGYGQLKKYGDSNMIFQRLE